MQIIGTEAGRTSYLLAWEEIRPLAGMAPSVLVAALTERYGFRYPPEQPRSWAEAQNRVTEFRGGVFEFGGRQIPMAIIAYSDAIAVECMNTDDSDAAMDDLMQWSREIGFRDFIRPPIKLYMSKLVVKFETELERLFKNWNELKSLMVQPAIAHYGNVEPFGAIHIEFRSDSRKIYNSFLVSNYIFERRTNEEYAENRYVCTAPLSTSEHIALLGKLENLVS